MLYVNILHIFAREERRNERDRERGPFLENVGRKRLGKNEEHDDGQHFR